MTEKLTMEHLESLLETMEPAQIREQYSADLVKNPQCQQFLQAFEEMDENLSLLKDLDAPPAFAKPLDAPIFVQVPKPPPSKQSIYLRLTRFALPLAAILVLGLLWGYRFLQLNPSNQAMPDMDDMAAAVPVEPSVSQPVTSMDASPAEAPPLLERGSASTPQLSSSFQSETPITESEELTTAFADSEGKDLEEAKKRSEGEPQQADTDRLAETLLFKEADAIAENPEPARKKSDLNSGVSDDLAGSSQVVTLPLVSAGEELDMEGQSLAVAPLERSKIQSFKAEESQGLSRYKEKSEAGAKSKRKTTASVPVTTANNWLDQFATAWNLGNRPPQYLFTNGVSVSWSLLGERLEGWQALEQRWQELLKGGAMGALTFEAASIEGNRTRVVWLKDNAPGGSLVLQLDATGKCVSIVQQN